MFVGKRENASSCILWKGKKGISDRHTVIAPPRRSTWQSEIATVAGVSSEYSLFDDTDTLLPKIGAIASARNWLLFGSSENGSICWS